MSLHSDKSDRLGPWAIVWLQLKRFQFDINKDRAERQAAPSLHRVEFAVRSYEAQRVASEED